MFCNSIWRRRAHFVLFLFHFFFFGLYLLQYPRLLWYHDNDIWRPLYDLFYDWKRKKRKRKNRRITSLGALRIDCNSSLSVYEQGNWCAPRFTALNSPRRLGRARRFMFLTGVTIVPRDTLMGSHNPVNRISMHEEKKKKKKGLVERYV